MKLVPGKLYKIYDRYALNLVGIYIGEEFKLTIDGGHNDVEALHYKFLIKDKFTFFDSYLIDNPGQPFGIRLTELEEQNDN